MFFQSSSEWRPLLRGTQCPTQGLLVDRGYFVSVSPDSQTLLCRGPLRPPCYFELH